MYHKGMAEMIASKKRPGVGHNKGPKLDNTKTPHSEVTKAAIRGDCEDVGGVAAKRIKAFIERIERLEEEKTAIAVDIKEVYGEAKATGFDSKTLRKIVIERKMDIEKRREEYELLDLYKTAIGME